MVKRESKCQNASRNGKTRVETAKHESKRQNASQNGKTQVETIKCLRKNILSSSWVSYLYEIIAVATHLLCPSHFPLVRQRPMATTMTRTVSMTTSTVISVGNVPLLIPGFSSGNKSLPSRHCQPSPPPPPPPAPPPHHHHSLPLFVYSVFSLSFLYLCLFFIFT